MAEVRTPEQQAKYEARQTDPFRWLGYVACDCGDPIVSTASPDGEDERGQFNACRRCGGRAHA